MKLIPTETTSLPTMYRHFAAVTIALTTMLAIFADGENRAAAAAQFSDRQQLNELERIDEQKFGKKELWKVEVEKKFTSDAALGQFGQPMTPMGARKQRDHGDGGIMPADMTIEAPRSQMVWLQFGMTEAQWNALSEKQRNALLKQIQTGRVAAVKGSQSGGLDKAIEASRARSGSSQFD
ncbi:MAG: hypothetical protein KDE63_06680 [Novosphingobium sp.]|nr:hypothetical protein [Novosphingobium sp.]